MVEHECTYSLAVDEGANLENVFGEENETLFGARVNDPIRELHAGRNAR